MKFREWLRQQEQAGMFPSGDPANDEPYNAKGVRSRWKSNVSPPDASLRVDPDDMYVTGKRKSRRKKIDGLSK